MSSSAKTVVVHEREQIPFNGIVVDGCALVDESACCGVSKPAWVDSAQGQPEVYRDGLIVSGWLKIEQADVPVLAQRTNDEDQFAQPPSAAQAPNEKTPDPAKPPRKPDLFILAIIAILAGIVCALVVSALTKSLPWIVVAAVLGFAGTMLEGFRR